MFTSPESRVVLRAVLGGTAVFLTSLAQAALGSSLELGEVLLAVSSGFGWGVASVGIEFGSKAVNPTVGKI